MNFEYKVVPAPTKGRKARGVKKPEDRFAYALQEAINEMAQLGWEFQRSETMTQRERAGITKYVTTERTLLVFRREIANNDAISSLENTLREVEKPRVTVAPVPAPMAEPIQAEEDSPVETTAEETPAVEPEHEIETPHVEQDPIELTPTQNVSTEPSVESSPAKRDEDEPDDDIEAEIAAIEAEIAAHEAGEDIDFGDDLDDDEDDEISEVAEPAPSVEKVTKAEHSEPLPKEAASDEPSERPMTKLEAARAAQRAKKIDESSFPNPRDPEPPVRKQAIYTKDALRSGARKDSEALPAALRSRATQSTQPKEQ